jgi:hypothetical protein
MQFVQLTLDGPAGTTGLVVRLDHVAYFQADVRTGQGGPANCGVLFTKTGERLRVLEDLDQFVEKLTVAENDS